MDGVHGQRLVDSVTWERDGDVFFVALPERITQQRLTFGLWMIVVAGILGPALHFACPWIFSSDVPAIPLAYRLGVMGFGVACLMALPVLRWRHDRKLRAELATCIEGPGKWAVELLVLGIRWYPKFPLGPSPRVAELVRAWKAHPWKNGAPGTVVVNLPKVAGLTVPAGNEADLAPPKRDWYFWLLKGFPLFGVGWALYTCVRTLVMGNISMQVTMTMCWTIAGLLWVLWVLTRGPKYPGMSGLLSRTGPGQIEVKDQLFIRDASVLLVFGMLGQYIGMLYGEAGKPRAIVPRYFAVAMLPQLLRRWGEPRTPDGTASARVAGR